MKILHTADWHIGFFQYTLSARRDDYSKAMFWLLEYAIDNGVDLILISGDAFNNKKPGFQTIKDFKVFVDKARGACIDIEAITGNHDYHNTYSWVDYFGLDGGGEYNNVRIYKENWSSRCADLAADLKIEEPGKFNILMLHQGLMSSYGGSITEEHVKAYSKFDYVALGHIHFPYIHKNLYNPGSLEYTSSDLWDKESGGFFIVDVNEDNSFTAEHVVTPKRYCKKYVLDISSKDEIFDLIKNLDIKDDSMVEIKINGSPRLLPVTVDLVEKEIKNKSLRLKIINNTYDQAVKISSEKKNVFDEVFKDKAALAKSVFETSLDNPEDVEGLIDN